MATTYNWNIQQMERKAADGFVTTVHYTVNAVDGEIQSSSYGTVGFTQEEMDYVPFADLTQEQVVGWVQAALDKDEIEANLAAQIEAQKNPVQQSGLPW
jgi:hypothetical protein